MHLVQHQQSLMGAFKGFPLLVQRALQLKLRVDCPEPTTNIVIGPLPQTSCPDILLA